MKAYKTWGQAPVDIRPDGIQIEWPWIVQDCTSEQTEELENNGFTVVSDGNYAAYLATYQEAMDSWAILYERSKIPSISPRQIRQALIINGVTLSEIETALDSLEEPTKSLAKIAWEYSVEFDRLDPLVIQVAQMLEWSETDMDELWLFAATL